VRRLGRALRGSFSLDNIVQNAVWILLYATFSALWPVIVHASTGLDWPSLALIATATFCAGSALLLILRRRRRPVAERISQEASEKSLDEWYGELLDRAYAFEERRPRIPDELERPDYTNDARQWLIDARDFLKAHVSSSAASHFYNDFGDQPLYEIRHLFIIDLPGWKEIIRMKCQELQQYVEEGATGLAVRETSRRRTEESGVPSSRAFEQKRTLKRETRDLFGRAYHRASEFRDNWAVDDASVIGLRDDVCRAVREAYGETEAAILDSRLPSSASFDPDRRGEWVDRFRQGLAEFIERTDPLDPRPDFKPADWEGFF
jgi:hypothetical protein